MIIAALAAALAIYLYAIYVAVRFVAGVLDGPYVDY
jgi:hypothetical protein